MYRVVIVDDNIHLLRSLSLSVDWQSLDCQVSGTARDGLEGLELICREKPHIVITDIHMPGIDGLDMVSRIKGELPGCRIVVITGYERFEYARQALALRVDDFLLKPVEMEELCASIREQVSRIRREEGQRLQQQLRERERKEQQRREAHMRRASLLEKLVHSEASVEGFVRQLRLEGIGDAAYVVAAVQLLSGKTAAGVRTEMEAMDGGGECYELVMRGRLVLVCFTTGSGAARGLRTLRAALGARMSGGSIGAYVVRHNGQGTLLSLAGDCNACVDALENKIYFRDLHRAGSQAGEPPQGRESLMLFLQQSIDALEEPDTPEEARRTIHSVVERVSLWQEEDIYLVQASMTVFAVLMVSRIGGAALSGGALRMDAITRGLRGAANMAALENYLCDIFGRCMQQRRQMKKYSLLVQAFLRHVQEGPCEELSLTGVAKRLSVSPTYLSGLIRKETGESFTDIVVRARLEAAKKSLLEPGRTVEEVAALTGYKSYISFYKAFKKYTGQTPSEYRESVLL